MQGTEQDAVVEASPATTDGGAAEIEVNAEMPPPRKRRRRRGRGHGAGAADGADAGVTVTDAGTDAASDTDTEPDADADTDPDAGDSDAPVSDATADGDEAEAVAEPAGRTGRANDAPCRHQSLSVLVEALLFSSDRPLTEARIADLVGLVGPRRAARIRGALDELDTMYRATGRSFRPRKIAGGWQLLTVPVLGPLMARLHRDRQERRLSPAALETLSIVAYRQPVVRAELEAIRGVACGEVLRSLMEKRLIRVVGRAEELGRPLLYGTTRQFLEVFGLSSLDDLPDVIGLERKPSTILRKDTPAGEDGASEPDASPRAGGDEPSGDAANGDAAAPTDETPASSDDAATEASDATPGDASADTTPGAGDDVPTPIVEVEAGLSPAGDAATSAPEKAGAE